jgi:hypothetical protein
MRNRWREFVNKARGQGNPAGWIRFGFRLDGSGQFDRLEEIGSDRVGSGSSRVGPIYMLYFFRSLIDFDLFEGILISNRDRLGQFDFLKKSDRIGFGPGQVRRVSRIGSGSATSTINASNCIWCSKPLKFYWVNILIVHWILMFIHI